MLRDTTCNIRFLSSRCRQCRGRVGVIQTAIFQQRKSYRCKEAGDYTDNIRRHVVLSHDTNLIYKRPTKSLDVRANRYLPDTGRTIYRVAVNCVSSDVL